MRRLVLALVLIGSVAHRARAEDIATYEAEGEGDVAGTDPRVVALDDAFAHAVGQALGDLLPGDTRTAHKQELDRELIGHARLWVVRFSVIKDQTADDRRQLTVSVRVDRDKMRERLTELKITAPAATPAGPPGRSVTVLLRITTPSGVRADYGAAADKDVPGLAATSSTLRGAGMTVKRAPASGPAAHAAGDLPLDDDDAEGLAGDAKADLAAIVGVTVGPPTPVRGVAAPESLISVHVRLIEKKGHAVIGQGAAVIAGTGDGQSAIDRAITAAMVDVVPPPPHQLTAGHPIAPANDTPIGTPGVVLVRLSPKTPFALVLAEQKHLTGAKGVQHVGLRRLSPAGWVIGVTTDLSIDRVASIAKQPPATDTAAAVKVVGEVVEVSLSGSP